jgi:apolipoprotein N-acyltransferase
VFLSGYSLVVRGALAAASGALAVLAFAPFSLFPVAVLALVLFYGLIAERSPREAFWLGWAFGVGLLGFGVFWIRISLNEFGNMASWLAYLLTLLFILAMALYYALVGWLVTRLAGATAWVGPGLLFPGAWVLGEWLRGWLFTGFPWLSIGSSQLGSPLAGFAPLVGVYGLSLLVAVSAGLLWWSLRSAGAPRYGGFAGLLALWVLGVGLQLVDWTRPGGEPFRATVVQANIEQSLKWDPQERVSSLRVYVDLTRDSYGSDVIVWPETAVPDFLHRVRDVFVGPLASEAREAGSELVIGIPVLDLDAQTYYNSLLSIGSSEDIYAKRHLVPFGEFLPFKTWLGPLADLFEVPMSDFSAGDPSRPPLLRVGPHLAGASICYEDAFPAEVAQAMPEAAYLINVSNDAWFGDSLAPHQHLEIARMRALENERWMVRATNTGISAIIDYKGRLAGIVPAFERGVFTTEVEPRSGATPFALLGNRPTIVIAFLMLTLGAYSHARRGRRQALPRRWQG